MKNELILHNNIKRIRTSKKITQDALAKQLGISRTSMGSIERGDSYPSAYLALAICHALDYKFEDLFYF